MDYVALSGRPHQSFSGLRYLWHLTRSSLCGCLVSVWSSQHHQRLQAIGGSPSGEYTGSWRRHRAAVLSFIQIRNFRVCSLQKSRRLTQACTQVGFGGGDLSTVYITYDVYIVMSRACVVNLPRSAGAPQEPTGCPTTGCGCAACVLRPALKRGTGDVGGTLQPTAGSTAGCNDLVVGYYDFMVVIIKSNQGKGDY
jgi:hypothetical protein